MAACDICEIVDYPNGCCNVSDADYEIWAACLYESASEYKKELEGYNSLPPHKR